MKTLSEQITALLTPSIEAMGFQVVQVKLMDSHHSRMLQIMAERPDGTIGVEDCAQISRQISAVLDVEDIITGEYRLEVSSPGIDRPLVRKADYEKFVGHLAKIETVLPVQGRKRFTGTIESVDNEIVKLKVDNAVVQLPLADISAAKLMLTDALLKMNAKKVS